MIGCGETEQRRRCLSVSGRGLTSAALCLRLCLKSHQSDLRVPLGTSGCTTDLFQEEIVYIACPKPLIFSMGESGMGPLSLC